MATLTLYAILSSNQDLRYDIDALKNQMQNLDPSSPEYQFDQLNLQLELETQKIREERPDLNPLNLRDAQILELLVSQDATCQRLREEMRLLSLEFSSQSTKWGIPFHYSATAPLS